MERTKLLNEIVELDAKINEATSLASRSRNGKQLDRAVAEVDELRKKRAEIQAKLKEVQ